MSAISFLRLLEDRSILDPAIAAELRRQIEASKTPIRTDDVANLLVSKGYLTAPQRERFVAEYRKQQQEAAKPKKSPPPVISETVQADDPAVFQQGISDFQLSPPAAGKRPKKSGKPAAPESPLDPFALPTDPLAISAETKKSSKSFTKKKTLRRWDSPLMLFGSGGLVVLTILMVLFVVLGMRGNASKVFAKAQDEYTAKSYTQAITTFDEFIRGYPSDPNVSKAKVLRSLAKIRQAFETLKSPEKGLAAAREELTVMATEDAFRSDGQPELASLLPSISVGLTARGKAASKTEDAQRLLALMKDSLSIVEDPLYISSKDRKGQEDRIFEVRSGIAEVTRRIKRDEELVKGLESIRVFLQKSETVAAYETRKKLIKEFPDLESNKQLADAVLAISKKQRELVVVSKLEDTASVEPWPASEAQSLALNAPHGSAVQGVDSQLVVLAVEGILYGLNVATGEVAWRRSFGQGAQIPITPLTKSTDVLVVDQLLGELVRVRGDNGAPVWRHDLGGDLFAPVVEGKLGLVSKRSGVLVEFDIDTGMATRQARLPQPLAAGVGVSSDKKSLLQAGGHSNLYSLNASDLTCRDAYYLAHREGTIAVSPVFVSGIAVVAENAGTDFAMLHFFTLNEKGEIQKAQDSVRVRGRITSPPVVLQRRMFVMSNAGELLIFEMDNTKKEKPATQIAALDSTSGDLVFPFALVQDATVWLADRRLQMLEIQSSRGTLARRWAVDEGDVYVAPLARFGEIVVTARRRAGSQSITASAKRLSDGATVWQNAISSPLSYAAPSADGSTLNVVDSQANYYQLKKEQFEKPIATGAASNPDTNRRALSFVDVVQAGDQKAGVFDPLHVREVLVFDSTAQTITLAEAGAPPNRSTLSPVGFLDGFLAATTGGQIVFVPPPGQQRSILPFQPELAPGATVNWLKPHSAGEEFFAGTTDGRVFRVKVQANPQPHLQLVAAAELNLELSGAVILLGDQVLTIAPGAAGDSVLPLALSDLSRSEPLQLGGRVTRPLERIGEVGFVCNPVDGLICLESGPKIRWKTPLAYGELAGSPVAMGNDWLLTSQSGTIWRVAGDSGKEVSRVQVNQPLVGPAVIWNDKCVLTGRDSVVHLIDKSKLEPAAE